MKNKLKFFIKPILFVLIGFLLHANFSSGQVTQPPQIAWGRYFEDPAHPEYDWSKEDLGEKIYYYKNNVYIVGRTKSDTNAFVNCSGIGASGNGDAFVASYNPACNTYNWVNYFGGLTSTDFAYCAAFDKVGSTTWIYIAGEVNAQSKTGLPTAMACVTGGCNSVFQTKGGDKYDGFIAKYNANTGQLVRWTYLGGKERDQILGIAVDTLTHNIYFNGYTESSSFINYSLLNITPYKSDLTGKGDMFVGCFDSCLNTLKYFTYFGGANSDRGHDLEILYTSKTEYLVMSGTTQSSNDVVPATSQFYDNAFGGVTDGGNPDAFLIIWNVASLSSGPEWATYFGGSGTDRGRGIAIISKNDIYLTGQTQSNPDGDKFNPTIDAYQSQRNGGVDGFVAKFHISSFNPVVASLSLFTYFGGHNDDFAKNVRVFKSNDASNGKDSVVIAGLTYSADLPSTDSTAIFISKPINGSGKELKRDAFVAVLTKDPANPSLKQKLSSFTYLGGENDETDIKQNDVLVQKSYNPGLDIGPYGSVFIIYSTKGTKTKKNGNLPMEYDAFHCPPGGCNSTAFFQPDAYFAQVFPFTQHFIPDNCLGRTEEPSLVNGGDLNDAVQFYPVPFSAVIMFKIIATENEIVKVMIYDLVGRLVLERNISLQSGENKIPFDLSGVAAGIYLSRIRLDDKYYKMKISKL